MRSSARSLGWAALLAVAAIGMVIGVVVLILLGGREAPEWQAKLLVWGVPVIAIAIYARYRSTASKRPKNKP
jgi:hypothetical protein